MEALKKLTGAMTRMSLFGSSVLGLMGWTSATYVSRGLEPFHEWGIPVTSALLAIALLEWIFGASRRNGLVFSVLAGVSAGLASGFSGGAAFIVGALIGVIPSMVMLALFLWLWWWATTHCFDTFQEDELALWLRRRFGDGSANDYLG